MKRFVIVQKSDLLIVHSYEAEASLLGTGVYGGPWNEESKVMHLEVPERLMSAPQSQLRIVHEMGVVSTSYEPCACNEGKPIFQEVYNKNGQLVVDAKGQPRYAQLFSKVETMGMVYNVKLVGE
jgi:hypothetical protein